MQNLILNHLSEQPRLLPAFLPLENLLCLEKTYHNDKKTYSFIDFGIEFSSSIDSATFFIDGKKYIKKIPMLSCRMPGHTYQMQTPGAWDVLVFSYRNDQLKRLQELGIDPENSGWEFHMTPEIMALIAEIRKKCENCFVPGFLDHLDMLALQLLRLIILESKKRSCLTDTNSRRIQEAASYLLIHADKKISLDHLIKKYNFSRRTFFRCWNACFNLSPADFLMIQKFNLACQLLKESDLKIYEIASRLNFSDQSYFCHIFKKRMGISPAEYRKIRNWKKSSTPL